MIDNECPCSGRTIKFTFETEVEIALNTRVKECTGGSLPNLTNDCTIMNSARQNRTILNPLTRSINGSNTSCSSYFATKQ